MDQRNVRATLETQLGRWDWSLGLAKREILDRLASDDPLRGAVEQSLTEGTYFSAQDVLNTLPDDHLAGLAADWRGRDNGHQNLSERGSIDPQELPAEGESGAAAQMRHVARLVGEKAQAAGQTATRVVGQAIDSVGVVASGTAAQGGAALQAMPDRMKQTASQAGDQVVSIRTRDQGSAPEGAAAGGARDAVSIAVGGMSDAYRRQPAKSVMIAMATLTIGAATGSIGWLARNVLKDDDLAVRADRLGPLLIGFWSAIFTLNLVDAWRHAQQAIAPTGERSATAPSTWSGLGSSNAAASSSRATAPTDEFPTVG